MARSGNYSAALNSASFSVHFPGSPDSPRLLIQRIMPREVITLECTRRLKRKENLFPITFPREIRKP